MTATYLVMVLIMEHWFQGFFGYRSLIATSVVAFLIAMFFNPLRERIQAFVDRALFHATPAELAEQREQLLTEVQKGDQLKAVATLAAGLAHEIKNPLSAIKTFAQYLPERYADSAFREKFFRVVQSEIDRINTIVKELSDFAKPAPLRLQPVHLAEIVQDTLALLSDQCLKQGVEVRTSFAENGQAIQADPQQIKQVILNLLLNSLEAMPRGGRLKVVSEASRSHLTLRVTDTGSGISPEHQQDIWDPFFTTKERGMGLGLAIVKGVMERHGGRIELSSVVGKGTRVELFLPTVPASF